MSIPARAGEGQLDAICRALARVDTAREPVSFPGAFEELLFSGDGSVLTCFVAPNQYEDFVLLLKRYQAAGRDFVWFYPVQGCCPDLPLGLEKQIRTVHSL